MKVFLGADHGGFALKGRIAEFLRELGHEVQDLGTAGPEAVDYPDFAARVAERVAKEQGSLGILVCSTGMGMSIAANKCKGIRAALCTTEYAARMAREHNNANVLCLGEQVLGDGLAKAVAGAFIETQFSSEERHRRRVGKMAALE